MRLDLRSLRTARNLHAICFAMTLTAAALALTSNAIFQASAATLSGATGIHDPSRIIYCKGKYYVYGTGGGMKSSSDGINWVAGPSPFAPTAPAAGAMPSRAVLPSSLRAVVPGDRGIWAPDVIFYNNKYLLYYSACAPLTVSRCGIGLLTSPTLDPSAPDYKWTDAGAVIYTDNKVIKKSAIDPGPFVDAKGDLWMSWGSGYANGATATDPTIIISKLDNATGLLSKSDPTYYPVAPGAIEASYVHYHAGFYYVFWNDGGCCGGTSSTYRIHVARSASPQGPYINKEGQHDAGDIFMATDKGKQIYGPGHMGIESEPGLDRFSFHYYNAAGRPVLGVRTLVWNADGWPSVGEDLSPGTYKITASNGLSLGLHGHSSVDSKPLELQRYTGSDFQKWTVAVTPEGYYQLTSVGSSKAFEVAASSADAKPASAMADQAPTGTGDKNQWIIDLTSDGKTYRLQSRGSQEMGALSISHAGGHKKPATLVSTAWNNLPTQKWIFSIP
jgi:arabinan endo-1,5-alpha-L-arabinosidase